MAKKYLDDIGLSHFFDKLKLLFATKDAATQSADGLMSSSDKTKLDGLDQLVESTTGESVTTSNCSGLESVVIYGKSVQNGTPTSSMPVDIQVVSPVNGTFGINVNGTVTTIDLQGNVLASLPDGTKDILTVDSVGHCVLTKNVGFVNALTNNSWRTSTSTNNVGMRYIVADIDSRAPITYEANSQYCYSSTPLTNKNFANSTIDGFGINSVVNGTRRVYWRFDPGEETYSVNLGLQIMESYGAEIYYPLATPLTIDLGYINPPTLNNGANVSIIASTTPTIKVSWWTVFAEPIANAIECLKDLILQQS